MPCTPTTGLSHSYIAQWVNTTMLQHSSSTDTIPSLDPIPSPARGRGRVRRRKDENAECPTPQPSSPHPPPCRANPARSRPARRQAPMPPALQFRRLAHKPLDRSIPRIPSDVTNKQHDEPTPLADMIFNMSPVQGLDGPSRPHRVASRLSAEPDTAASFLYSYTWDVPETEPPPPYPATTDTDKTASEPLADESQLDDELAQCLVDVPVMPRLGRLHAKSDPLPAHLSSTSTSLLGLGRTQPIPIPKPSPRVPSDYGGVSSVSMSIALPEGAIPIPIPTTRWARVPAAARERKKSRREPGIVPTAVPEEPEPAVPATRRKKRFFLAESYDGDMDSEYSSWRPQ